MLAQRNITLAKDNRKSSEKMVTFVHWNRGDSSVCDSIDWKRRKIDSRIRAHAAARCWTENSGIKSWNIDGLRDSDHEHVFSRSLATISNCASFRGEHGVRVPGLHVLFISCLVSEKWRTELWFLFYLLPARRTTHKYHIGTFITCCW